MKIDGPFGSGCVQDPDGFTLVVTDCVDPDSITWTMLYPDPATNPMPTITALGDGRHRVNGATAGSVVLRGECCG